MKRPSSSISLSGIGVAPEGLRGKRVDTNAIFEALRYRISTLQYPPGSALKELDLCAEFGVSRTPIRQALQRLELVGLVQPVVGHGTLVTSVDVTSMRQLLQYRLCLAQMLGEFLTVPGDSEGLKLLYEARDKHAKLQKEFDASRFAEISHSVRWAVCIHIGNPFMAQSWIDTYYLASRIWYVCLPIRQALFVELQEREINELIVAFEAADPNAISVVVHRTLAVWVQEIWRSIADGGA